MQHPKTIIKTLILFLGGALMFGFVEESPEKKVAIAIQKDYLLKLQDFKLNLEKLEKLNVNDSSIEIIRLTFLECRNTFKAAEFLLTYHDNVTSKGYNAPNLLTSPYIVSSKAELKEPHGLQVMEEIIYEESDIDRQALLQEIELLKGLLNKEIAVQESNEISQAHFYNLVVLDALRLELYRIEALGITGFDVPYSLHAIPEAIASLQSMKDVISFYEPLLAEKGMGLLYTEGEKNLISAIQYLERNNDFNELDRLYLIDNYLHEISSWLHSLTMSLDYLYPTNKDAFNREASHLFESNSLNKAYFSQTISPASIELGEKLFNEVSLSSNSTRSCATCHIPSLAFTDGMVKNIAIDSSTLLTRNTPSLSNVVYQTKFFYDSRVRDLEKQSLDVIQNKLEMGADLASVVNILQQDSSYKVLFDEVYNGTVTSYSLSKSLADYVSQLTSHNSKLDSYFEGDKQALNSSEKNGFNLFMGKAKCATCHFAPLFNGLVPPHYKDTESEIVGVPIIKEHQNIIDEDEGRYLTTQLNIHKFAFKTPGIRDVALTAPYMHNGVFETLEEVVDFYNNGGGVGQGMDLPSQTLPSDSLHLSAQEKTDLVNFMKALTDQKYEDY